jgi:hypothetical protein
MSEVDFRETLKRGSVVRAVWNMNGTYGMADADILELYGDFAIVQLQDHADNWLGAGTVLALPFYGAYDFSRNHGIYPVSDKLG